MDQELKIEIAERSQVYLTLNISGPSGSGKTMSALRMAYGITKNWAKVGVIDSENRSASLYSHMGKFVVINLESPFSPERYIQAISMLIAAGIEVVIIDSSTHEWNGKGGCVEINDLLAKAKYKGNTWSAWNETTPRHDRFLQTILQAKAHVITCTRSKTETVMGEDKKVKKLGMKDQQREGWEYELTVSLNLDRETHTATSSKDRTNVFEKRDPFIITEKTGEEIKAWCELGIEIKPDSDLLKPTTPLTDKAVQGAIERALKGDKEVIGKLRASYALTEAQEKMIADANIPA